MASIPRMDEPPPPDRMLPAIAGMVPNVHDLPVGCAFQDRCPKVHERCRLEEPPLAAVGTTHDVRCWLHVA